jgi:Flp pilus assembly pilin Flp
MIKCFSRFIHETSGAAAIECGLIAAVIGVAIIASSQTLRDAINARLDATSAIVTTFQ